MTIQVLHDMREANGKTIRENNLARPHTIPVGTLVELPETGERLYVCLHTRDCDGCPLYALALHEVLVFLGTVRGCLGEGEVLADVLDPALLAAQLPAAALRHRSHVEDGYSTDNLTVVSSLIALDLY